MEDIDSGYIMNRKNWKYYPYEMKLLNINHLEEIVDLHGRIIKELKNPQLCITITSEEFQRMLGYQGMMFGVFVEKEMVAFRGIFFPEDLEENLGPIMGLKKRELHQVAHLEITNVVSHYRGNGLQKKMLMIALERLRQMKVYHHIFSIASPYNYHSIQNLFSMNMYLINIKEMYGGRLRYIFYKNLFEPAFLDLNHLQIIDLDNIVGQKKLIDKGYAGFKINNGNKGNALIFAQRLDTKSRFL